jgi:hypothetical protein
MDVAPFCVTKGGLIPSAISGLVLGALVDYGIQLVIGHDLRN